MPRMWTIEYQGESASMAAASLKTIQRIQDEQLPHVICGRAGAVWRVAGVEHGHPFRVALEPVDAHDVNPCVGLGEMPLPNAAS